jgi:hypothetical protein
LDWGENENTRDGGRRQKAEEKKRSQQQQQQHQNPSAALLCLLDATSGNPSHALPGQRKTKTRWSAKWTLLLPTISRWVHCRISASANRTDGAAPQILTFASAGHPQNLCFRALQAEESSGLLSKAKKKRLRKKAKDAAKEGVKPQDQVCSALVRVGCGGDSESPPAGINGDNEEIESMFVNDSICKKKYFSQIIFVLHYLSKMFFSCLFLCVQF